MGADSVSCSTLIVVTDLNPCPPHSTKTYSSLTRPSILIIFLSLKRIKKEKEKKPQVTKKKRQCPFQGHWRPPACLRYVGIVLIVTLWGCGGASFSFVPQNHQQNYTILQHQHSFFSFAVGGLSLLATNSRIF